MNTISCNILTHSPQSPASVSGQFISSQILLYICPHVESLSVSTDPVRELGADEFIQSWKCQNCLLCNPIYVQIISYLSLPVLKFQLNTFQQWAHYKVLHVSSGYSLQERHYGLGTIIKYSNQSNKENPTNGFINMDSSTTVHLGRHHLVDSLKQLKVYFLKICFLHFLPPNLMTR